jgi:hypothetical protein
MQQCACVIGWLDSRMHGCGSLDPHFLCPGYGREDAQQQGIE